MGKKTWFWRVCTDTRIHTACSGYVIWQIFLQSCKIGKFWTALLYGIQWSIQPYPHLVLTTLRFSKLLFLVQKWIFGFFWLNLNAISEPLMALGMLRNAQGCLNGYLGMPGDALHSRNWNILSSYTKSNCKKWQFPKKKFNLKKTNSDFPSISSIFIDFFTRISVKEYKIWNSKVIPVILSYCGLL